MKPSVKAILARFGGNREAAIAYCADMASGKYPRITAEYLEYLDAIRTEAQHV